MFRKSPSRVLRHLRWFREHCVESDTLQYKMTRSSTSSNYSLPTKYCLVYFKLSLRPFTLPSQEALCTVCSLCLNFDHKFKPHTTINLIAMLWFCGNLWTWERYRVKLSYLPDAVCRFSRGGMGGCSGKDEERSGDHIRRLGAGGGPPPISALAADATAVHSRGQYTSKRITRGMAIGIQGRGET